MKFTASQQTLSKTLNTVSKAVSSRTTIPILKGILVEAKDGKVKFSASDLDLSIEKTISAENAAVYEEGSVVVLARLFGDIIRKLPGEDVEIETIEDNKVILRTSSSEFVIVGISPDEFPAFGETEDDAETFIFNKDMLKEMISKTSFSASIDEAKGIITGVLLESDETKINMVALDGFRMAVTRKYNENGKKSKIIISAKIINELGKIIAETEEDCDLKLTVGKKKAIAELAETKVVMRLLEGEFIKYKDIIPKEHKIRIVADRNAVLESVERASLLAKEGKNNLIIMKIEGNNLTVTSRSEEGKVKEEIIITNDGGNLEIGFNSKYIIDAVKNISDESIAMEFNSGVNPCLIKPIEGDAFEYLILPVRITGSSN